MSNAIVSNSKEYNHKKILNKNTLFVVICLALILLGYLIITMLWQFPDTVQLYRQSIYFWNVLSEGKMPVFYEYLASQDKWLYGSWISSFPLNIGILPLWIIGRITGKQNDLFSVLYIKFLLILSLAFLCYFIYKIILHFQENNRKAAAFSVLFVAGSLELLDSIGYAGQDEIFYLLFYVIGLFFLLKQKHIPCLVFFCFTVTTCPIMIVPIICNYLIYYKNLFKLFACFLVLIAPSVLFEFAYANDSAWQIEKVQNTIGTFQLMMTTGTIASSVGPVPIAFVVIVIVAILSYLVKKDEEKRDCICIRYSAVVFFALAFLTSVTFYRYCIYVPIFAILLGINNKSIDLKGFLLFLIETTRFLYSLINGYNMEYRFLSDITVRQFGEKVLAGGTDLCIFNRSSGLSDSIFCIIRPIIIGCSLFFLYLHFKDGEHAFPIKVKTTILINSMAGVVLAGFTIYQIMTTF